MQIGTATGSRHQVFPGSNPGRRTTIRLCSSMGERGIDIADTKVQFFPEVPNNDKYIAE